MGQVIDKIVVSQDQPSQTNTLWIDPIKKSISVFNNGTYQKVGSAGKEEEKEEEKDPTQLDPRLVKLLEEYREKNVVVEYGMVDSLVGPILQIVMVGPSPSEDGTNCSVFFMEGSEGCNFLMSYLESDYKYNGLLAICVTYESPGSPEGFNSEAFLFDAAYTTRNHLNKCFLGQSIDFIKAIDYDGSANIMYFKIGTDTIPGGIILCRDIALYNEEPFAIVTFGTDVNNPQIMAGFNGIISIPSYREIVQPFTEGIMLGKSVKDFVFADGYTMDIKYIPLTCTRGEHGTGISGDEFFYELKGDNIVIRYNMDYNTIIELYESDYIVLINTSPIYTEPTTDPNVVKSDTIYLSTDIDPQNYLNYLSFRITEEVSGEEKSVVLKDGEVAVLGSNMICIDSLSLDPDDNNRILITLKRIPIQTTTTQP